MTWFESMPVLFVTGMLSWFKCLFVPCGVSTLSWPTEYLASKYCYSSVNQMLVAKIKSLCLVRFGFHLTEKNKAPILNGQFFGQRPNPEHANWLLEISMLPVGGVLSWLSVICNHNLFRSQLGQPDWNQSVVSLRAKVGQTIVLVLNSIAWNLSWSDLSQAVKLPKRLVVLITFILQLIEILTYLINSDIRTKNWVENSPNSILDTDALAYTLKRLNSSVYFYTEIIEQWEL